EPRQSERPVQTGHAHARGTRQEPVELIPPEPSDELTVAGKPIAHAGQHAVSPLVSMTAGQYESVLPSRKQSRHHGRDKLDSLVPGEPPRENERALSAGRRQGAPGMWPAAGNGD